MISGKLEIQPNSPVGTVVVCTIEKGTSESPATLSHNRTSVS
jgi:hypothetical protein